jgi:hypothetical protein
MAGLFFELLGGDPGLFWINFLEIKLRRVTAASHE